MEFNPIPIGEFAENSADYIRKEDRRAAVLPAEPDYSGKRWREPLNLE